MSLLYTHSKWLADSWIMEIERHSVMYSATISVETLCDAIFVYANFV